MKTSAGVKQIAVGLLGVQDEIKGMRPDASNPFFKNKYTTLDGILEYIRPILTKAGIIVMQNAHGEGEYAEVTTTLLHISGEYIQTDTLKVRPTKNDAQQMGSAITYAKRYQLSALLGISSEIDDDGNKATHGKDKPSNGSGAMGTAPKLLSEKQVGRFYAIAKSSGYDADTANRALQIKYNLTDPSLLTKAQYDEVCKAMESKRRETRVPTSAEVDAAIDEDVPF